MARPAYIVFAESGAIDQPTNRASFFNVVENLDVIQQEGNATPPAGAGQRATFRIVVAWMKEPADTPDIVFESEVVCLAPSGEPFFGGHATTFTFPPEINFHRLYVNDLHIPGFPALGVYNIEARLRRRGEEGWTTRQTYPFLVRQVAAPNPPNAD